MTNAVTHVQSIHHMNIHMQNNTATKPLGLTEYPVLGTLSLGAAHGYDVFRFLNDNLHDICHFGRSQTYAVLTRLQHEGLVSHEKVEQENLPAKKVFQLTPIGREIFNSWMQAPVAHIRDLRVEFLVKLFFAGLTASGVREKLLTEQLKVCRRKTDRLMELRRGARDSIETQALEYRIAVVRATVEWLKGLMDSHSSSIPPEGSTREEMQ